MIDKLEKELFILRVGGSVLSDRKESTPKINLSNIKLVISEIKKAKKEKDFNLIIVHGMGSFGHPVAKKFDLHKTGINPKKAKGVVELTESLRNLNSIFVKLLIKDGLNAISYQTNHVITNRRKIIRMPLEPIKKYLQMGLISVLYASPVYDISNGISILSADHLAFSQKS